MYFAYVNASWQLYFITSWMLPVTSIEPWTFYSPFFYNSVDLSLVYSIFATFTRLVAAD